MGRYVTVVGWFECAFDDVKMIKKTINETIESASEFGVDKEIASFYLKGWRIPDEQINWTSFVFFGADIKSEALPYIENQLLMISKLNIEISGSFFLRSEDNDFDKNIEERWIVQKGHIKKIGR